MTIRSICEDLIFGDGEIDNAAEHFKLADPFV